VVRMQILVEPKHKRLAEKLARQSDSSASDVFRRALEAYNPEAQKDQQDLETLAVVLDQNTRRARKALLKAEKDVKETIAYFSSKKIPLKNTPKKC